MTERGEPVNGGNDIRLPGLADELRTQLDPQYIAAAFCAPPCSGLEGLKNIARALPLIALTSLELMAMATGFDRINEFQGLKNNQIIFSLEMITIGLSVFPLGVTNRYVMRRYLHLPV